MSTAETKTIITRPEILKWFRRTSNNEVFVKSPCVKTENPYHLKIGNVYEFHILKSEDGGVKVGYGKLLWVYKKGWFFHIIAVDIETGELFHMSQRLGSDSTCDFIVADVLYYDFEDLSTKILRGLTTDDMELLEFEFGEEE